MNKYELLSKVQEKYEGREVFDDDSNDQGIVIESGLVPEIFEWLRDDPEMKFDYLEFETAVDRPPDHLDMIYSVFSYEHQHRLCLKVQLPRTHPQIASIIHLWTNADWNEREVYDLYGIHFTGHPDLRRLMMPEDWEGHPLRKDYMHPNVVPRPD